VFRQCNYILHYRYIIYIGSTFGPLEVRIHMYELKRMEGFKWPCIHV